MNSVRREQLRDFLEKNQVVTLRKICERMPEVSLMTIHRDLNFLQDQGLIVKIRGGARYIAGGHNEPAFAAREIVNKAAKQAVAAKAIPLMAGSGSIFIDAGTTMMTIAKQMPDVAANIMTTGPNIALELAKKRNILINVCGGTLNKNNLTLSGAAALETISHINIDIAFLVASGYSTSAGFTCGWENEARIKMLVADKARTSVMLIDSSKIEKMLPHTFAQMNAFDFVITEKRPEELPEAFLRDIRAVSHLRLL